MKKERFEQLTDSLAEVARHFGSGRFRGRISEVEIGADDIRAARADAPRDSRRMRKRPRPTSW